MPFPGTPGYRLRSAIAACASLVGLLAANSAIAGLTTYRLGEQDFASGAGPILVSDAKAAGANESYPFDGTVFGDDRTPTFGRIRFRYDVAATAPVVDVTLTIGLVGLDSPPGSKPTVKLLLDGQKQPNAAFAGVSSPSQRSSASVVSVPVPADLLADGILDVAIKSFRHGPGYPGNAIEADFSTLTIIDLSSPPPGGGIPPGSGLPPDDGVIPGDDPDETPGGQTPGGQTPGGQIPGDGGAGPVPSVPVPPAVLLGAMGLAMTGWRLRRRV